MERHEEQALINAIALRVGTARQLSERFGIPVDDLRTFATDNMERIKAAKARLEGTDPVPDGKALSPEQLSDLWITNKFKRLKRLQAIAEETEKVILQGGASVSVPEITMAVREFRSYLALAANELGQLLHRGSGDAASGDVLSVEIGGVDMENLR